MAIIDKAGISIVNFSGEPVTRIVTKVAWELLTPTRANLLTIRLRRYLNNAQASRPHTCPNEHKIKAFCDSIVSASNILVTGSETKYHTSLIISMMGSRFLKKRFEPVMASEFNTILTR